MPRKPSPPLPIPPDNPELRDFIIVGCMTQLSLADLEAVGNACAARWQALTQAQQDAEETQEDAEPV